MKRNQEPTRPPAFTLSSRIRNGKSVQNCIISVLVGLSSIACGRLVSKFDANTSALAPIGPKCAKGADGKCADAPRDDNVTAATATPTVSASPTASPTTSPSPTATATASPSPTVTATASPSPTASPKPTASPTATATASPTPTASPTATATATPKPTATPDNDDDDDD